ETVLPDIQRRADEEDASESAHKDQLDRWWQHWRARRELIAAVARLRRYLVCSRVTKRPIFTFVASAVRPGDALQVFALEDDYGFSAQKDSLTQLLALNLTVAARLEKGDPVSAPGVPKNYPNAASLVSDDCVEPREGTAPNPIPLASVPIVKYGNTDAKGKRR